MTKPVRHYIGIAPGLGIFGYCLWITQDFRLSIIFGWLAFSIAIGSMAYFVIVMPFGLQASTTVFGREQFYRHAVPRIPIKTGLRIIALTILCCVVALGLYHLDY